MKRILDTTELMVNGELLKKAILKYSGVEYITDNIPDFFTVGYYLKECYECIDKFVEFFDDYAARVENADDEIRLCERYALVISKINDSLKVLNNLSELKANCGELFAFKVVEDAVISDIYSGIILKYRETVLLEIEN